MRGWPLAALFLLWLLRVFDTKRPMKQLIFILLAIAVGLSSSPSLGQAVVISDQLVAGDAMMMGDHDHHAMMSMGTSDTQRESSDISVIDGANLINTACDQQQGQCQHDCHKAIVGGAALPVVMMVPNPVMQVQSVVVSPSKVLTDRATLPLIQPPKYSF